MGISKRDTTVAVETLQRAPRGSVIDAELSFSIFRYRVDTGLSQRELAEKIQIHQATLCKAERAQPISLKVRLRILRFLHPEVEPEVQA